MQQLAILVLLSSTKPLNSTPSTPQTPKTIISSSSSPKKSLSQVVINISRRHRCSLNCRLTLTHCFSSPLEFNALPSKKNNINAHKNFSSMLRDTSERDGKRLKLSIFNQRLIFNHSDERNENLCLACDFSLSLSSLTLDFFGFEGNVHESEKYIFHYGKQWGSN